jgi:tetratricopeptide (TPR) repeat protein
VRIPPSARAPNFSAPDFTDDVGRVSALPVEPIAPEEERAREAPTKVPPPASLTERPSPLEVDRTSSELANAERALEAMTHFRLAESALQRSDLAQAERLASRAVTADPEQTDYVALHAWIRAMAAGTDERAAEAVQTLAHLLAKEPDNERALLYRGKLNKKLNRARDALRDFERLAQQNPRHREAALEVRLLRSKK